MVRVTAQDMAAERKAALTAADEYFQRFDESLNPTIRVLTETQQRNPLLPLVYADGYIAGRKSLTKELFERVTPLRLALRDLLDGEGEMCRLDHEGYCQEHRVSKPCIVAAARRTLDLDGAST